MSHEDRVKRDAEETLQKQKADLVKRELRISISNERIPRVISLASFFPDSALIGDEQDGDKTIS